MHVDDWLDLPSNNEGEVFAKEFLEHCRRPADKIDYDWLEKTALFCVYKGKKVRCVGASRMGDVWLTHDLTAHRGYDLRVDVEDCSQWTKE